MNMIVLEKVRSLKTPEEIWTRRPPSLKHLRVFGCAAYAHQSEGKLEPRSLKGVFLGYPLGVKGYRVWLRDQKGFKLIISRDVIFDESKMPCKNLDQPTEFKTDPLKDDVNTIQVEVGSPPHGPDIVEENPIEDDKATHSDGMHQVIEGQNQLEVTIPLADCELVGDRVRRISKPNSKFSYADVVSFALCTGQELENSKPRTYIEAVNCIDKLKWQQAMLEEMDSFKKN
ncbi:hypothetical protein Q3G72_016700 [Acer saccharum]|nr:hypothetical protein Q3G72_016700 [Acer saccharum]